MTHETITHADAPAESPPAAKIEGLTISFRRPDGTDYAAVQGIDLTIGAREVVGIVGESGSGKSLTARSLIRLLPPKSTVTGTVTIGGRSVLSMSDKDLRGIRGKAAAMVFQDPMTSFNPVRTIGDQIAETLRIHSELRGRALQDRVTRLLSQVGIVNPKARAGDYPAAYSGGMRQRAMIAMAMANDPGLLIADEPTTALDATVQDQVLNLLRQMHCSLGTSIVLITHNIAVVASLADRVVVMYSGRVVEEAPVETILTDPQHPYTWMLLRSVPRMAARQLRLPSIQGSPPDPAAPPSGCRFHPRCPFAVDRCRQDEPALESTGTDRRVRCFLRMESIPGEARNV